MSGIATAVVASAVVGGVVANKSAKEQAKAAKSGADAETALGYANLDLQKELADQMREDFAPWRDVGEQALNKLWAGVQAGDFTPTAFDPSKVDVTQDPGYQFRMDQGVEALDKSAAARGRLLSGAQQKGVNEYAQNVASNEYANAYAREAEQYNREANEKANQFNMLSGLSSGGQASAAQQAGATSQLASTSGNIMSNMGQSQNMAAQQQGAARAGAYQGTGKAVNQATQNWLTYKMMG